MQPRIGQSEALALPAAVPETALPPEPLWPPEELARKQAVAENAGIPLTPAVQKAIRCAECILARSVFQDDVPSFTLKELLVCTGVARETLRLQLKSWQSRFIVEDTDSLTRNIGRFRWHTYRLAHTEVENQLFRPAARLGCERTFAMNFLENLSGRQHELLKNLSELSPNEHITQAELHHQTRINSQTIHVQTKVFSAAGVITTPQPAFRSVGSKTSANYVLTERGLWLLDQIFASDPAQVPEALAERIKVLYPAEFQTDTLTTVKQHLAMGMLQVNSAEKNKLDPAGRTPRLEFTPLARNNANQQGQLAIAFYLDLLPLLRPAQRPVNGSDLRRILKLPLGTDLSGFIAKQYYRPLRQLLEQSAQSL